MTAVDLLRSDPCTDCESNVKVWDEPPYSTCRQSQYGDHECVRYFAAYDLEQLALSVADDLANHCRHVEAGAKKELAEAIAEAIDEALFAVGARFDVGAFLKVAGVTSV